MGHGKKKTMFIRDCEKEFVNTEGKLLFRWKKYNSFSLTPVNEEHSSLGYWTGQVIAEEIDQVAQL